MPLHDPAFPSIPWSCDPSAPDTTHDVVFGPVRSGKSVFCPDAVLPKPSGAAAPLPPSQAAATGDEA